MVLKLVPPPKRNGNGESSIQKVFFRWLSLAHPYVRALSFAIPNGGRREIKEAVAMKAAGVTAGVPDIFIAVPTDYYAGLFIEFKYKDNKLTGLQQAFVARLREAGYKVDVCYSFEEAREVVLDYIKGSDYV